MENLLKEQNMMLEKLAQTYDLELVLLFGSRAAGTARQDSDYDVGYASRKKLAFEEKRQLCIELLPIIQPLDERLLDLTDIKETNALLRYHIALNSRILYGNPLDYHMFRALAFKQYVDTAPLRQLEKIMIEKRQKYLTEAYGR